MAPKEQLRSLALPLYFLGDTQGLLMELELPLMGARGSQV